MTDHYETRCPSCGGSDEQGCYADCPTSVITALRAEVERLTRLLRAEQELGEFYRENIGRLRAEKEKMRAALSKISEYEIEEGCPCNACQHSAIARAALKGETNGN